jgi:hypothetical protein
VTVGEFRDALPIHCYEAFAEGFRRCWHMLAPGKDLPAECGSYDNCELRRGALASVARWRAWRDMLGPSDEAALCSLAMMPERDD